MAEEELPPLPISNGVIEIDKMTYQRKIGSILYVAISTKSDIVFAAQQPDFRDIIVTQVESIKLQIR